MKPNMKQTSWTVRTQVTEPGSREDDGALSGSIDRLRSFGPAIGTILLISEDWQLHENLRSLANINGQMVVRVPGSAGAVTLLRVIRPVAVLLDLDLPNETAWATADLLLKEPVCPPLILLTSRIGQFDMQTVLQAGSLVAKNESPCRLWEIVEESLEMPEVNRAERNSIQSVLLGRLRPSRWAESSPARLNRFWGINE